MQNAGYFQSIGFNSFDSFSYLLTVLSISVNRAFFSALSMAPLKDLRRMATVVPEAGMWVLSSAAVGKGAGVG